MQIAADVSRPPVPSSTASSPSGPPRLLARVRERIRYLHYSLRTKQTYVYCGVYRH